MPAVSVIVPAFNRVRYLRLALESVFAQTFADWELLVADDGSGDETRAYLAGLEHPRARVLWLPHSGNPGRARNAAVAAAAGEWLAFLDSDDVWDATKLDKQVRLMRDRLACRWSYTRCRRIDDEGRPLGNELLDRYVPHQGFILEPLLKLEAMIAMPTVMADRRLVVEAGGFDERLRSGEYLDLCLRLAMRSPVAALDEPLCAVRAHAENFSKDRVGEYAGWVALYGKMAQLLPDARLRALSRRLRADKALVLAGFHGDAGRPGVAAATLAAAAGYAWRYPSWWLGAAKALARPFVPASLRLAYRARFVARAAAEGSPAPPPVGSRSP